MLSTIFIILIFLILFTFAFVSYALYTVGLNTIAKREEAKPYYLAWIPYLNKYTLGKIAFKSNDKAILLTLSNIFTLVFLFPTLFIRDNPTLVLALGLVIFIFSIVSAIFNFVAHYKIYERYSKSTVIMTILDIISFGILGPFFIFAVKDNEINNKEKITENESK